MHADITSSHKLRSNITSLECYDIFHVFQSTDEWSLRSPAWFTSHCSVNHRRTCCMIFISPQKGGRLCRITSPADKCSVPRTHNTFAETFFTATSCRVWNNLPSSLRAQDLNYDHFKHALKTLCVQLDHNSIWLYELLFSPMAEMTIQYNTIQ